MTTLVRALLLLIVFIGASFSNAFAQADPQIAKTFAEHVADNGTSSVRVTIGALPEGWTPSVPLPQATLLGTVADSQRHVLTLYYDTSNLRSVYDAYVSALKSSGFSTLQPTLRGGGFAVSAISDIPRDVTFCNGDRGVQVYIPINRSDDLRLNIQQSPSPYQMCPTSAGRAWSEAASTSPLPILTAPPGTKLAPIGEVVPFLYAGKTRAVTEAMITGDATAQAILNSLEAQLRAAHWRIGTSLAGQDAGLAAFEYGSGPSGWHGSLMLYPYGSRTFIARIDVNGSGLTGQQKAMADSYHLPKISIPFKKSQEPDLVRLTKRIARYGGAFPQTLFIRSAPPTLSKAVPLPEPKPLGSIGVTRPPAYAMAANPDFTLYYTLSARELQSYYARLKSRGWINFSLPPESIGGFKSPYQAQFAVFCKPKLADIMITVPAESGDVNIDITREGCDSMQKRVAQMAAQITNPLPVLTAPAGVTMNLGQAGFPGGANGARFLNARSASQLLDWFTAQFARAGWKKGASTTTPSVGTASYTKTGADGRHWQAVLTVYASARELGTYYGFVDVTNLE